MAEKIQQTPRKRIMKTSSKTLTNKFKPFELTITVETEEEANQLDFLFRYPPLQEVCDKLDTWGIGKELCQRNRYCPDTYNKMLVNLKKRVTERHAKAFESFPYKGD